MQKNALFLTVHLNKRAKTWTSPTWTYPATFSTWSFTSFSRTCCGHKWWYQQHVSSSTAFDQDKPLLRFLWCDLKKDVPPSIYERQVLPFGNTCSPCCAVFALQRHVASQTLLNDPVCHLVERGFYVDYCLQSFPTVAMAQSNLEQLRSILSSGGFDMSHWASNDPRFKGHLPPDARSTKSEFWLSKDTVPPTECTLGLR